MHFAFRRAGRRPARASFRIGTVQRRAGIRPAAIEEGPRVITYDSTHARLDVAVPHALAAGARFVRHQGALYALKPLWRAKGAGDGVLEVQVLKQLATGAVARPAPAAVG